MMVGAIVRAEHLVVSIAGVVLYLGLGGHALVLVPALLAPDLSMVGYLFGPRAGAVTYNVVHNFVVALVAIGLGWWLGVGWLLLTAAVLLAHVGADRTLGYGLKLPSDFRDTHLGRIGRE
jgi:Domain of unknown function (DUF4260)